MLTYYGKLYRLNSKYESDSYIEAVINAEHIINLLIQSDIRHINMTRSYAIDDGIGKV